MKDIHLLLSKRSRFETVLSGALSVNYEQIDNKQAYMCFQVRLMEEIGHRLLDNHAVPASMRRYHPVVRHSNLSLIDHLAQNGLSYLPLSFSRPPSFTRARSSV